eukprot:TRINITY_DN7731_c0_g3_i2.p1 TRINITY_DN7731_c0_g3~~TRINITY_DN7731_c0_g3_i2.p1  ORF type:complete len:268 (+),score=69.99 TRINITY_DN7731_c0_g3_i2:147-950(+)
MWPSEIKDLVSERKAREVWERVVFPGVPFVGQAQAKDIIFLIQEESHYPHINVDLILKDWNRRSRRPGCYGYKTFIQSFLSKPEEENPFKNIPKSSTLSPDLHTAVSRKDEQTVKKLLLQGADPNYTEGKEGSILYEALGNTPITIIKMLLQAGADTNYVYVMEIDRYGVITPSSCFDNVLHLKDPKFILLLSLLLEYGGNPNQMPNEEYERKADYTPLHTAITKSNLSAIEILLEAGADPNIPYIKYENISKYMCVAAIAEIWGKH